MTSTPTPTLYTQPGCGDSARVRAWLTERGVPFTECSVADDLAAAEALAATGTFATPLFVVGETTVLGFRPERLVAALGEDQPPE